MAIRRNILRSTTARDQYIRGVTLLKQEFPGTTTTSLGIPGPSRSLSTYDLFTIWHHVAMTTSTPPGHPFRNAAHAGPVFLPWHRFMLLQLEMNLQRVLNNLDFGLPYWDWAADGQRPPSSQGTSRIWAATCMGGNGIPVSTGPFAFDSNDPDTWRVVIEVTSGGQLVQANRGLRRDIGAASPALPRKTHTRAALRITPYDQDPWDPDSDGFRNTLEGWIGTPSQFHNQVHQFVGGDMLRSTSPNDPVFYLNHCNVDRVWEAWMRPSPRGHGRVYAPGASAPTSLRGHRLNDTLTSILSATTTPAEMLNVTQLYTYDRLTV